MDHWRRRHRTGHALAEQFWSGSPATLSVAETPLRWSRGDTKARLLRPQNAHDLRSGMGGANAQAAHARLKDKWREVFTVSVSMSGGGETHL